MNMIGKKRGAVISGEEINIEKVANILIDDFRSGRLGRITLEKLEGEEIGNILKQLTFESESFERILYSSGVYKEKKFGYSI